MRRIVSSGSLLNRAQIKTRAGCWNPASLILSAVANCKDEPLPNNMSAQTVCYETGWTTPQWFCRLLLKHKKIEFGKWIMPTQTPLNAGIDSFKLKSLISDTRWPVGFNWHQQWPWIVTHCFAVSADLWIDLTCTWEKWIIACYRLQRITSTLSCKTGIN